MNVSHFEQIYVYSNHHHVITNNAYSDQTSDNISSDNFVPDLNFGVTQSCTS